MGVNRSAGVANNGQLIDSKGRALVFSISEPGQIAALLAGESYFLTTGIITLTNTGESWLLYLKNNNPKDLIITDFILSSTSDGTAGTPVQLKANVQPTAGTLISAGTVAVIGNLKVGSSAVSQAEGLIGIQGSTITDGTPIPINVSAALDKRIEQPIVLPLGASLAISITPPTANTSMPLVLTIRFHVRQDEEIK